jgi:hypothetical protein
MVFVLDGGPRAGQLVDDLPAGYRTESRPDGHRPVSLFEDFFADVAVWAGDRGETRESDSVDNRIW